MSKNKTKEKKVTEIEILKNIEKKLDRLTGIMAIQGKERKTQVQILTTMGFNSSEVASLIGATPENVRQINFQEKNKKTKVTGTSNKISLKKEIEGTKNV